MQQPDLGLILFSLHFCLIIHGKPSHSFFTFNTLIWTKNFLQTKKKSLNVSVSFDTIQTSKFYRPNRQITYKLCLGTGINYGLDNLCTNRSIHNISGQGDVIKVLYKNSCIWAKNVHRM